MIKIQSKKYFIGNDNKTIIVLLADGFNHKFRGKAVCTSEDEYDVEKGKKIAYNKAKKKLIQKYQRAIEAEVANQQKLVNKYYDNVNKEIKKCQLIIENCDENISNIF